ncbi:DUF2189 domain-containing protein [Limnohabitans sp.]|uniref:DUF2189 domain-containing protein n=1 Tax=Limnohabitans sp. TaxID=1907725 RepID=UPI00286EEC7F|nr:DUF2189 domain-containing protein [Limnohabitans sp.]
MQQLVPDEAHDRIDIHPIRLIDPLRWLWHGLCDMVSQPLISLFYGMCFWLMALILLAVFKSNPEYTLSAVSGFLLISPFLAMGLYDVSMHMERGEPPSMGSSLTCWESHIRSMSMLIMVMVVMELLWGRASLVVFAVFFNSAGMPTTATVLEAVFNPQNWEFIAAYICVGGFFAGLVFASMMVSIPMILDRDTDAVTACITSLRVFVDRTAVSVFWGALITLLVVLAMLPSAAGLLVVGPWLGFTSWHAYRAAVHVTPASAA